MRLRERPGYKALRVCPAQAAITREVEENVDVLLHEWTGLCSSTVAELT